MEESGLRAGPKEEVAKTRETFRQLLIGKTGHPGTGMAYYLEVTPSSVNRLAVSEETLDVKKYLAML